MLVLLNARDHGKTTRRAGGAYKESTRRLDATGLKQLGASNLERRKTFNRYCTLIKKNNFSIAVITRSWLKTFLHTKPP